MYVYTAVVLLIAEGCYYVSGGVFEFMIQISFFNTEDLPLFFFFFFLLFFAHYFFVVVAHIDSAVTIAFSHVH